MPQLSQHTIDRLSELIDDFDSSGVVLQVAPEDIKRVLAELTANLK